MNWLASLCYAVAIASAGAFALILRIGVRRRRREERVLSILQAGTGLTAPGICRSCGLEAGSINADLARLIGQGRVRSRQIFQRTFYYREP